MVDGISKQTPDSGWQEPIAGAQQLAPDPDEVSSEPAFRPEWLAQRVLVPERIFGRALLVVTP